MENKIEKKLKYSLEVVRVAVKLYYEANVTFHSESEIIMMLSSYLFIF